MADEDKTSELYPIAVLIDELKVRYLTCNNFYIGLSADRASSTTMSFSDLTLSTAFLPSHSP